MDIDRRAGHKGPAVPLNAGPAHPEEYVLYPKMAKWKEFLYLTTAVLVVGTGLAAFGAFVAASITDKHLSPYDQLNPESGCFRIQDPDTKTRP